MLLRVEDDQRSVTDMRTRCCGGDRIYHVAFSPILDLTLSSSQMCCTHLADGSSRYRTLRYL